MTNSSHHKTNNNFITTIHNLSPPFLLSRRRRFPNSSFPIIHYLSARSYPHSHLLQAISSSVIPALTHIINTSLHTGTFPTAFKQARVSPLLKKPALNPALLETTDRYPSSIHCKVTWASCVQPTLSVSCTEQHSGQQPIWLQKWPLNWDCPTLGYRGPETGKSSFQILCTHLVGSVCCLWHS